MPVHDVNILEAGVVGHVGRDDGETVDSSDGGDLTVGEGRRSSLEAQPRPLRGLPPGRPRVVRQYGDRRLHDLPQIPLDGRAPGRRGQTVTTEEQLVPDHGSGGNFTPVLPQTLEDSTVGRRQQGFGQDVRVQ